jgi:Uma2 family endonuclease
MATITTTPREHPGAKDMRVVIRGVGWQGYQKLLDVVGDRPVRLTYDRGDVELMSPSMPHERYKKILARLVEAITAELEIPCEGAGSTTWRREDLDRGLEPDECYYIAHADQVACRNDLDPSTDPPPDLAIEVDISPSALDRPAIYAALGVPELWRFDGETLRIEQLQDDGTYRLCDASPALPFLKAAEIRQWLAQADTMGQTAWDRQLRAWVRTELGPRRS